MIICD